MLLHSSLIALATALFLLCVAGCTREQAAAPGDTASSEVAPNLMRLATVCNAQHGEWIKGKGCGMTEKYCFATYHGHGTWFNGPGCNVPRSNYADCRHEGMYPGDQYRCYIHYIPIADLNNTK